MLPAERLQKILNYINNNKSANVKELGELVNTSESTIRRDLDKLVMRGLINRTHGGAVTNALSTTTEKKAEEKRNLKWNEKDYIGKYAAQYISDGESIIVDSGSTTLSLCRNINNKRDLTVITYDLKIALETALGPNCSMIVTGGIRRDDFEVLIGSETESFIKRLNVDKAFIGTDAVDLDKGLTNATFAEVSIKQEIIKAAKKVILLADYTKFGKTALVEVAPLEEIDIIITDSGIDQEVFEKIKKKGIWIGLADINTDL